MLHPNFTTGGPAPCKETDVPVLIDTPGIVHPGTDPLAPGLFTFCHRL